MLHEAESSLRKALVLNPQLMSALSYLALLTLETGRIDEAAHTAERALAINPNCSDAYISLGHVYRWAGILGESERAFERATALDPYTPRLLSSGMTYLYAGKAAQALDIFTTCQPHACFSLLWQGMALLALDRIAESRKRFEAVVATSPMSTARWLAEAYLAWMGRNFVEGRTAMRALERMFAPAGEGGEALYHFGRMCTALGDSAAGIAMLQRAVDSDFVPYPYFVVDPFLDPVRAEPAFSRLLAQAEARHEAFKRSLCSQVRQPDPAAQ